MIINKQNIVILYFMFDIVTFNNREFPVRTLFMDNFGEVVISTEELNSCLMIEGSYVSENAHLLDESIFFFIPKEIFKKSEKFVEQFILSNL